MTTTIKFNTGRKYTQFGQRITATLHDDGVVTFFDHDRQVDGQFVLPRLASFNQTEVMHWYDSGTANGTQRSWADGMLRDGCNRAWEPPVAARAPVVALTEAEASILAMEDKYYYPVCRNGRWLVWDGTSDHEVTFDDAAHMRAKINAAITYRNG
jgi:hypothetical protein